MLFVLLVVTTITFFLMHNIPGDPLTALVQKLPEQTKANYYAKYGLDKPVFEQFLLFLKGIFTQGTLGESIRYPGRMVTDVIKKYASCSGEIGLISIAVGFLLGTMFGVVAALKKNKLPDKILSLIAILGVSIPGIRRGFRSSVRLYPEISYSAHYGLGLSKIYGASHHLYEPFSAGYLHPLHAFQRSGWWSVRLHHHGRSKR